MWYLDFASFTACRIKWERPRIDQWGKLGPQFTLYLGNLVYLPKVTYLQSNNWSKMKQLTAGAVQLWIRSGRYFSLIDRCPSKDLIYFVDLIFEVTFRPTWNCWISAFQGHDTLFSVLYLRNDIFWLSWFACQYQLGIKGMKRNTLLLGLYAGLFCFYQLPIRSMFNAIHRLHCLELNTWFLWCLLWRDWGSWRFSGG